MISIEQARERELRRFTRTMEILNDNAVQYERSGNKLVIRHGGKEIHFWPSTHSWMVSDGLRKRGIDSLLNYLKVNL